MTNAIFAIDLQDHEAIETLDFSSLADGDKFMDPGKPCIIVDASNGMKAHEKNANKVSMLLFRAKAPNSQSWKTSGIFSEEIPNAEAILDDLQSCGPLGNAGKDYRIQSDYFTKKVHWTVAWPH